MLSGVIAACYVAWNEADAIGESIRSVKAYVDRVIVVAGAFSTNPAADPEGSASRQWAAVHAASHPLPVTYIEPPIRLEEHQARDMYLDELADGEWAFLLDADEILIGDHARIQAQVDELPDAGALVVPVVTQAVLFHGNADAMGPDAYATAPIIGTRGYQPRLVRAADGLRYQRDEIAPGRFTHHVLWCDGARVTGPAWDDALVLNRHVAQPFAGYLADYAWETAQRDGAR